MYNYCLCQTLVPDVGEAGKSTSEANWIGVPRLGWICSFSLNTSPLLP